MRLNLVNPNSHVTHRNGHQDLEDPLDLFASQCHPHASDSVAETLSGANRTHGTAAMIGRDVGARDPTSESSNTSIRCCADTAEKPPLFADVVCFVVRGDSPWFNVGSSRRSPLCRLLCSFPIKPLRPHHHHHHPISIPKNSVAHLRNLCAMPYALGDSSMKNVDVDAASPVDPVSLYAATSVLGRDHVTNTPQPFWI
jgi:hypothetical protein